MKPQKYNGKPNLMKGPAKRESEAQNIQLEDKNYNLLDSNPSHDACTMNQPEIKRSTTVYNGA